MSCAWVHDIFHSELFYVAVMYRKAIFKPHGSVPRHHKLFLNLPVKQISHAFDLSTAQFFFSTLLTHVCVSEAHVTVKRKRELVHGEIYSEQTFLSLNMRIYLGGQRSWDTGGTVPAAVSVCSPFIPRKVSLSLSSIAGPKLSIKSRSEKVPLAQ